MTKRILIPTDFSKQAQAALLTAVKLAKKLNAELFILHSVDIYDGLIPRSYNPEDPDSREKIMIDRAEELIKEHIASEGIQDLNPTSIIGKNDILQDILDACKTHRIDFIVMGSSGASGLEEMFIGSNTERVVRYSKVPVIVIKDKPIDLDQKSHFVFASSLKKKDKSALEKAKKVAELLETNLELLYINTQTNFKTTKDIFEMISNFLTEEERPSIKVVVHNGNSIEEGIIDYMQEHKEVFYGIGTNGRKGLARLFNDSIAERLVNRAPSSIICFNID